MDKSALERDALMEIISKLEGMVGEEEGMKDPEDPSMNPLDDEKMESLKNPTGSLPEAMGMEEENSPNPAFVVGADDKPPMRDRKMMDMGGKGAPKMDIKAVLMKSKLKR